MSKIAVQKSFKEYPLRTLKDFEKDFERVEVFDGNIFERQAYIKGYDQAMQDFLEKACEWLKDTQLENFICFDDGICFNNEKLVERFKNYMQNEEK